MNQYDLDRLNYISKKSLDESITPDELKEFKELIDDWSESPEYNLLEGFHQYTDESGRNN